MNQNYKMQIYSQNTIIFISYEMLDHIAVYNYMFRPLSTLVRSRRWPIDAKTC